MKEENSESKIKEEGLTPDFVQVWRKCMKILLFLCENVPQWEDRSEGIYPFSGWGELIAVVNR